jgi:hypothetical protein
MDSVNKCSMPDGPLSCAWEKREAVAYPEFSALALTLPSPRLRAEGAEGADEGQWRLTRRHLLAGLCLDPRVKPEDDGVRGGTLYPPQTSQHAGAREENTNPSPQSSSSGLTRGSRHKRSGATVKGQTLRFGGEGLGEAGSDGTLPLSWQIGSLGGLRGPQAFDFSVLPHMGGGGNRVARLCPRPARPNA